MAGWSTEGWRMPDPGEVEGIDRFALALSEGLRSPDLAVASPMEALARRRSGHYEL
jgi:hypothetical protein